SEETARIIDEEVKRLIDDAFARAQRLVDENWPRIVAVAEALLKYETLQGEEVQKLIRGERLDKPTGAELLEKEASKGTTAKPRRIPPGQAPAGDIMPSPA